MLFCYFVKLCCTLILLHSERRRRGFREHHRQRHSLSNVHLQSSIPFSFYRLEGHHIESQSQKHERTCPHQCPCSWKNRTVHSPARRSWCCRSRCCRSQCCRSQCCWSQCYRSQCCRSRCCRLRAVTRGPVARCRRSRCCRLQCREFTARTQVYSTVALSHCLTVALSHCRTAIFARAHCCIRLACAQGTWFPCLSPHLPLDHFCCRVRLQP